MKQGAGDAGLRRTRRRGGDKPAPPRTGSARKQRAATEVQQPLRFCDHSIRGGREGTLPPTGGGFLS